MTHATHDLVRMFFATMAGAKLNPDLFTEDFTAWTNSNAVDIPGEKYLGGVKMLQSLFPGGLHYTVDAVFAEGDRAGTEVHSHGVLHTGEEFGNNYAYTFVIRDGKIAALREYFNPIPVVEKIVPLMQAAMAAKAAG